MTFWAASSQISVSENKELKRTCSIILILFLFLFSVNASSVLSKPYKVYVLKTEHFDILFPKKSEKTAQIIERNIEELYQKVLKTLDSSANLHMPVLISPDSEHFSVSYTPNPYNRIIVFEAYPGLSLQNEDEILLGQLYEEIFRAVLQSEKSGLNTFIANTIGGSSYQPVAQLNMPFSFIQGFSSISQPFSKISQNDENYKNDEDYENDENSTVSDSPSASENGFPSHESYDKIQNGEFQEQEQLELLVQAKIEGKFPSHFQARITNDIYPHNQVILAATAGFSAYLLQLYGIEKFLELWKESGKLNLLFADGVFYNIYQKPLSVLWQDFYDSVPVPQNSDEILENEKKTVQILPKNSQGLYRNLIFSDYGLIWYDEIRHEVDIFEKLSDLQKPYNPFSIRNLLFLANDIEYISLSPDGRFLAVSFTQIKNRKEFKKKACWIFDLQERKFLSQKYFFQNAAVFSSAENQNYFENDDEDSKPKLIAGINIEETYPKLQVFTFSDDDKNQFLIYEKNFAQNELPESVFFTPDGKIVLLISKNQSQFIKMIDLSVLSEENFTLSPIFFQNFPDGKKQIKIKNLRISRNTQKKVHNVHQDFVLAFDYAFVHDIGFTKCGYITLNENFEPENAFFMQDEFSGGVNWACFCDEDVYFSSQKYMNDELRKIKKADLTFVQSEIYKIPNQKDFEGTVSGQTQNDLELNERYNPWKYFFPFSVRPMLPVRSISADDEPELWPGVGVTFISQTDPFENTEFYISAGWTFAQLDFETVFNPSDDYEKKRLKNERLIQKDKSASIFIKNSSTPVDISAGSLFRFNLSGEYHFEGIVGTSWQIPLGMNFSNMKIKIDSDYTASTDYYDSNLIDKKPSLSNWPTFQDAYEFFEASVTTEYSNIHQYGISPYEKRGFSVGLRIYSNWDLTQIRILNNLNKEQSDLIASDDPDYQNKLGELKKLYDSQLLNMSQINLGAFATIEIPRLTPLKMTHGWVLSLPASVSASIFNETGTALKVNAEILLLGKEIHDGFSLLQLYFGRIGLKSGYELQLKYDTSKVLQPDIRRKNYAGQILSETYVKDNFYFLLNFDFTTSIGFSTASMFSIENKFAFYPKSNGFLYSFNFIARF